MNDKDYEKSHEYWADIPPTLDGVLGGFGFISDLDIEGSKLFLKSLMLTNPDFGTSRALDCGAGIGRVTKHLLIPHFDIVDVVEPDEKFTKTLKSFVGENNQKIDKIYKMGLQEFNPERKYNLIWNQWVLGYLTDEDLVSYLARCRNSVKEHGIIVVKENVSSSGKPEKDFIDSSVTRSLKQLLNIFKRAKLKRIKQSKQTNFPKGIYPVYMFALIPDITQENITPMCTKSLNQN